MFCIDVDILIVIMMTSSNGNIFRVTGPLCGEFTGPGEFPAQRPVTRSFDVFFDMRPNKLLIKQPWDWWFETPSWSLWRQCNNFVKHVVRLLFLQGCFTGTGAITGAIVWLPRCRPMKQPWRIWAKPVATKPQQNTRQQESRASLLEFTV